MYVSIPYAGSTHGGQKRALVPLEQESLVLGTEQTFCKWTTLWLQSCLSSTQEQGIFCLLISMLSVTLSGTHPIRKCAHHSLSGTHSIPKSAHHAPFFFQPFVSSVLRPLSIDEVPTILKDFQPVSKNLWAVWNLPMQIPTRYLPSLVLLCPNLQSPPKANKKTESHM